jgi:hypothetical protein
MQEVITRIRPTPMLKYMPNPHRGCCTFNAFNGDPLGPGSEPIEFQPSLRPAMNGFVPTTVAHCRWFWSTLAPSPDKFDFRPVESALKRCRGSGQTLSVRLVPFGDNSLPSDSLPEWYSKSYKTFTSSGADSYKTPDINSNEYFQHFGALISEFGARFGQDPALECVDLAYVGRWGAGEGKCSLKQAERFIALYKKAFKKTHLLTFLDGFKAREALDAGAGWRVEAFGDLRSTGSSQVPNVASWNHHFDVYPKILCQLEAQDTWKTRPVFLQSFGTLQQWYENEWDIDFVLEQALKFHATYFDARYNPIPEAWMLKFQDFFNRLGYRFVLRQVVSERKVDREAAFNIQLWIENTGVAPIYRKYDLAVRLRQENREEILVFKSADMTKWLPGDHWIEERFIVPRTFRPGVADVSVGMIDPDSKSAKVSFSVKEMYADKWVPTGIVEIK